MLCAICSALNLRAAYFPGVVKSPPKHHASTQALKASALEGCKACQVLVEHAVKHRQMIGDGEETFLESEKGQIFYKTYCRDDASRAPNYLGADMIWFYQDGGISLDFGLYVSQDSLAASNGLVCGRPVARFAGSEECFRDIERWMQECLTEHGTSCPAGDSLRLPTRVVDVGPEDGTATPKLYATGRTQGKWLTLSHCWGNEVRFVTESSNLAQRFAGIDMDTLPRTFSDAIKFTRRLGFRYIWIDSLCILQDSTEDWLAESSKMQEYYRGSMLTVAPDHLSGDEQGFLNYDRHPYSDSDVFLVAMPLNLVVNNIAPAQRSTQSHLNNDYVRFRARMDRYDAISHAQPLNSRGWTLQEDLLSPRSVHYASKQLYWECQKHRKVESIEGVVETAGALTKIETHMKHMFLRSPSNLVLRNSWYTIVESYMQRDLTRSEDKFPAISGLAREIANQTGFTYKAGIWLEDFRRGLLWSYCATGYRSTTWKYIAPSWSWASLSVVVKHPLHAVRVLGNTTGPNAELLSCDVTPEREDIYGRLTSGILTIRSSWCSLSKWDPTSGILLNSSIQYRQIYECENSSSVLTIGLVCHLDSDMRYFEEGRLLYSADDTVEAHAGIVKDMYLLHITSGPAGAKLDKFASYYLLLTPVKLKSDRKADSQYKIDDTPGEWVSGEHKEHYQRIGIAETTLDTFQGFRGWETRVISIV
ncbi:hypothetical protein D0Z07_8717 [Hyphodiscus hymeniophilus]|uniref:Heterokaryon incompatibility domain-containing protein n=1 Tax=Hyphodiscus hymeniophilus TaxID=353542 RepID=A0A9P6SKV8_9HELO|nr:hypothetical protein D0Z07_8717 [Hyphodiscus hymeniophilus]